MSDYSKNFEHSIIGHTGGTGDDMTVKSTKGKLADQVNARDLISALVGAGGMSGLRPDDRSAVNAALVGYLGKDVASKVIDQVSIFNSRPDMLKKSAQQRIDSFYTMGSRDPQVDTLLKKSSQLGQGAISDLSQTSDALTKKISVGADVMSDPKKNSANQQAAQTQLGSL